MTLLQIVQEILAEMGSDNVNSINDTIEAQDVARIVAATFREIVDFYDVPAVYTLFNLLPSDEVDEEGKPKQPTVMFLPNDVAHIDWIKYAS